MNDQYFYGTDGGEVQGPLPLGTIRAAVAAGRLPTGVALSKNATGPWAPLVTVEKLGSESFGLGGKARQAKLAKQAAQPASSSRVAGWVDVMAFVHLVIGGICLVWGGFLLSAGNPSALVWAITAASNIFVGVLLLAVADALKTLHEIRDSVRKH